MKSFKVTVIFDSNDHVTLDFVKEYFERMISEKIHNPAIIEVEEAEHISEKL